MQFSLLLSANRKEEKMISRIWRGWIPPQNADKSAALLRERIFIGIQAVISAALELLNHSWALLCY